MLSFLIGILKYQLMLIGIVSVFTFAFMEKNKENYFRIGIFAIIFLVYFLYLWLYSLLDNYKTKKYTYSSNCSYDNKCFRLYSYSVFYYNI